MNICIKNLYEVFIGNPVISTDSRNITENSIFWALRGETFDGNKFVNQAVSNGAAYAVTDDVFYKDIIDDKIFYVENTLTALQNLASLHRDNLKAKVIGITGTNGKTTTKELIKEVLSKKYKVCATKGNFNNHIGLPLTILSADGECEILVVEMGANHKGEIADLCKLAKPDYGIITNIGKAHLEGFKTFENIIETKKALYDFVADNNGTLFVNADNNLLLDLSKNCKRTTYGVSLISDCYVDNISKGVFPEIKWKYLKNIGSAKTNLVGIHNFENIAAAICIGGFFDVPDFAIENALKNYKPNNNRSQYFETKNNKLILDAYNANPSSMVLAIRNFAESNFVHKALILGDMLELGDYSEKEHQNIIDLIEICNFSNVYLIGETFCKLNKNPDFIAFSDIIQAKKYFAAKKLSDYTILLKGSRGLKIDTLTDCL